MNEIRLGSLFDGIGVFPLAAVRCGIVPAWASEIEKAPISITKRHFPGMAHLGDVTKLNGGDIPPVHIITFGSPCQNLSQIGNRAGLAGEKSSLFFHAIRIIREMREATNGIFPAIAVWENVMGAFFQMTGWTLEPCSQRSQPPTFQCLLLEDGQEPEWCEGIRPISHGGSWMPSIGQAPDWHDGSASLLWQTLEDNVPTKYFLSPAQCSQFLRLAEIAGCPPPAEIEALLLKQGGVYRSPDPFNATVCGHRQRSGQRRRSETASDCQLTLFPLC